MAVHRTLALLLRRYALGEADRLVEFYTRDFGRVRGVARRARRPRSRLAGALEPFTLGTLVFFDTGRSELVRVDHFDLGQAFLRLREDLERLGHGAWILETVSRLSAERDPQPPLFSLVARSLRALEEGKPPARVITAFALRGLDLLGHRPRLDRCGVCARPGPLVEAALSMAAGGLVCAGCRSGTASPLSGSAVGALVRLRGLRWEEVLRLPLAPALDGELTTALQGALTELMGEVPRAARFLLQTRRGLGPQGAPTPADRS